MIKKKHPKKLKMGNNLSLGTAVRTKEKEHLWIKVDISIKVVIPHAAESVFI